MGEVDVLLGIQTYDVGWDVHDLLTDANMSLPNEHTSMMDALGQPELEHLGLETTFHEILNTKTQHVIELHLAFIEYSNTYKTTQKSVTLEETLRVLLGQGELDPPYFTLVSQTILSDEFQLLVQTLLLKGTSGSCVGLPAYQRDTWHLGLFGTCYRRHHGKER